MMTTQNHMYGWKAILYRLLGIVAFALLTLTITACGLSSTNATLSSTATLSQHTATVAATTKTYPVKVYLSKYPQSEHNFSVTFPVDRVSPTTSVATFAIQLLIAGPTPQEYQVGYFAVINNLFSGQSNCKITPIRTGPDFKLNLNKKGNVPEKGTVTLQFCRTTSSAGIGEDALAISEINATLKQFPTIKKVVILTKDGHCFGDGSGLDRCLK
ncbi:MAG: hypothetical protein NVS9B9_26420 [Ktedonobacteraceae bacterium]